MTEEDRIILHIKKSDMKAKNKYEFGMLEAARFYFVPCTAEELSDELWLTFHTEGMRPFQEAKGMRRAEQYSLILQVIEAVEENPEYYFSLNPDNLFLDRQNRVRILNRDVADKSEEEADAKLKDIKAFAGFLFQKRYSYENLREGGLRLLEKQKGGKSILALENFEQAGELFGKAYAQEKAKDSRELIHVKKKAYRRCRRIMGIALAGCAAMFLLVLYQRYGIIRPQGQALMAERAYMENDFIKAADALAQVPVDQIERHEKFILAAVSIRGQSVDAFNMETKERLLSRLSYQGDESLLDYWIYLGRGDVDQALDTAMRMSDNQLLLYAYLQKLEMISSDASLTGEMKAQETASLREKIRSLAQELGIEYEESETEAE